MQSAIDRQKIGNWYLLKDYYFMIFKNAPDQYLRLLVSARAALELPKQRRPIIIGIDGQNGAGKTSVASWLAWQLGAKALHLDLYSTYDAEGRRVGWREDDLAQAIKNRVDSQRKPIIVEGVLLLEALGAIKRNTDFLVYVRRRDTTSCNKLPSVVRYLQSRNPPIRQSDHSLLGW